MQKNIFIIACKIFEWYIFLLEYLKTDMMTDAYCNLIKKFYLKVCLKL